MCVGFPNPLFCRDCSFQVRGYTAPEAVSHEPQAQEPSTPIVAELPADKNTPPVVNGLNPERGSLAKLTRKFDTTAVRNSFGTSSRSYLTHWKV